MSQADQTFSVTELSSHPSGGMPHREVKPSGELYEVGRLMRRLSARHDEADNAWLSAEEGSKATAEQVFQGLDTTLHRLERRAVRMKPRTHADAVALLVTAYFVADQMANCGFSRAEMHGRAASLKTALHRIAPFLARGAGVGTDDVGWGHSRLWSDEIAFDHAGPNEVSQVA